MIYFAYGSNMLSRRFLKRVPSANALGTGILRHHQLAFHKVIGKMVQGSVASSLLMRMKFSECFSKLLPAINRNWTKSKDWAKGMLVHTDIDCEFADEVLTIDEQMYIVDEVAKIGERLIKGDAENNLEDIIRKHYNIVEE